MTAQLKYTDEVAKSTAAFYPRIAKFYPEAQWRVLAPYVHEINRLKREKNAVILAHNYMTPDIFHCVADVVGDSLALAREAAKSDADIIVQAGVHFMAETAKILNPNKIVLMPDMKAGCSLAESITAADVRKLREQYPGVPIITYVNTSAEVKAESDICCTSGNAVKIVEGLGVPEVLLIPDQYLAAYVASRTNVKVHTWQGACEVHERFTAADVNKFKISGSNVIVMAHPECPPDVIEAADFAGSTQQMIQYVEKHKPQKVVMVTECSMSDNVAAAHPEVEFLSGCRMCPHMKRISLPKILHSLQTMTTQIEIPAELSARARKAVDRMLEPERLMTADLPLAVIEPLLRRALEEDLGADGDITSNATIPKDVRANAVMRARKAGVLAGIEGAAHVFRLLDPAAKITFHGKDGGDLSPGQDIFSVEGNARAVLAAERTALNFISHLSGIASETRRMADLIKHTKARVCCTRKTNPGLRLAEKYAVRMGGGDNHRIGLYDAMLVKDNHIAVAGSIRAATEQALAARKPGVRLEIEVDTLEQLMEILDLPVDAVLLDNMSPDQLRACVDLVAGRFITEASGGVNAANIRGLAEAGVDVISLGWLTHSAPALDIGLDIEI